MPIHEPDEEDPLELSVVGIPDPSGEATRAMAACFAEEFLRLGFEPGRVLSLFESPRYALAHRAWLELGAHAIHAIVEEQARTWSPTHRTVPAT
jgi:hypothetical protein